MEFIAPRTDKTSSVAHSSHPGPGRPRMVDPMPENLTQVSIKRQRMRLAQRSYRARKEDELTRIKKRTAELETALDRSRDTFWRFCKNLLENEAVETPPHIMLELSRTAFEMASIAHQAGLQFPDFAAHPLAPVMTAPEARSCDDNESRGFPAFHVPTAIPNTVDMPARNVPGAMLDFHGNGNGDNSRRGMPSVSTRLFGACMERALSILSALQRGPQPFPTALSIALRMQPASVLLSRTRLLTSTVPSVEDAQYPPLPSTNPPFRLIRLVEGDESTAVPRLPPPLLQRLRFGGTRTRVLTNDPHLSGDWLEAGDVEEYLEARGIAVQGNFWVDIINLRVRGDTATPPVVRVNPEVVEESSGASSEVQGNSFHTGPFDSTTSSAYASDRLHGVRPSQRMDLLPRNEFSHGLSVDSQPPSGTWQHSLNLDTSSWSSRSAPIKRGACPTDPNAQITISMDKLIRELAANAICLGPGPGIRRNHIDEAIRKSLTSPIEPSGPRAM